ARNSLLRGLRVDDRPARDRRSGGDPAALHRGAHPGPRHGDPDPGRSPRTLCRRQPLPVLHGRGARALAPRLRGDPRLGPLPRRKEDLL
ncbi:Na(+) H(+) antiporter subunit F, partial [uncultured Rubrobacteraceae bacterium]